MCACAFFVLFVMKICIMDTLYNIQLIPEHACLFYFPFEKPFLFVCYKVNGTYMASFDCAVNLPFTCRNLNISPFLLFGFQEDWFVDISMLRERGFWNDERIELYEQSMVWYNNLMNFSSLVWMFLFMSVIKGRGILVSNFCL